MNFDNIVSHEKALAHQRGTNIPTEVAERRAATRILEGFDSPGEAIEYFAALPDGAICYDMYGFQYNKGDVERATSVLSRDRSDAHRALAELQRRIAELSIQEDAEQSIVLLERGNEVAGISHEEGKYLVYEVVYDPGTYWESPCSDVQDLSEHDNLPDAILSLFRRMVEAYLAPLFEEVTWVPEGDLDE